MRHLHRILGVDLTALPGLSTVNVHTSFAEVGGDLARFPTVKHFTSWLGLCPDHRISGSKVLSAHTRTVKSHTAYALRMRVIIPRNVTATPPAGMTSDYVSCMADSF
jgi:transposase